MRQAFAMALIFLVAGCAAPGGTKGKFTQHYENSIFKVTEKEQFSVELLFKEGNFRVGVNTVDIIIHDGKDRDVKGAELQVVPWMPEMGHGVSTEPEIIERGGGVYTARDVMANMPGRWQLKIGISARGVKDRVVFDFPYVGPEEGRMEMGREHGEGMEGMPAGELDLSRSRTSQNGLFNVSYSSRSTGMPLNSFISWELEVLRPDGSPVEGAEIWVEGSMPAHGHGFPTEPEVTRELGGGRYLVEGIKFSMPGYWIAIFHIKDGSRMDSVEFNLMLK